MEVCGWIKTKALHTSSQGPALRGQEEVTSSISCSYWLWYEKPVLWCGQGIGMESLQRCTWPLGALCRRKPNQCWHSCQSWSLCLQALQSGNTQGGNHRAAGFCKSKTDLDALPPTQNALILHIKCTNYQTMVWNKMLEPCPSLPKPEDSRWYYSEARRPPEAKVNDVRSVSGVFTVSILWVLLRKRMLC